MTAARPFIDTLVRDDHSTHAKRTTAGSNPIHRISAASVQGCDVSQELSDGLWNTAQWGIQGPRFHWIMNGVEFGYMDASGFGGDRVSFLQAGTGAISRSMRDKAREWRSVEDFGAVGDGTTDDRANIQKAIDAVSAAGGGVVRFLGKTYRIAAELVVPASVLLLGESRGATYIRQSTLNAKIVRFTGTYAGLKSLSLGYNGTPTSGGVAIYAASGATQLIFEDFYIRNCYVGVELTGGPGTFNYKLSRFEIADYEDIGLYFRNTVDIFVNQFILDAGNSTRGARGGIRLEDQVEACIVCDGDILKGVYSITTEAAVYGAATRPAYNNFSNVFFDSAVGSGTDGASVLHEIVESEFVGCWFSGGRDGGGRPGLTIKTTESLKFTGCRWFNNGGHGCVLTSAAVRTTFVNPSFQSNSVTAGSGNAHGLQVDANTNDFSIIGGVASNSLFSGLQGYGINIAAGTSTRYSIRGLLASGNVTGEISDGGTGSSKYIENAGAVTAGIITARGGAIQFPATQVPSADPNAFDDYEESDFTPGITFDTPGNLSVVLSTALGKRTKKGREVTIHITAVTSTFTHTTASGGLKITGVPDTPANVTGMFWTGSLQFQGITKAGYTQFVARLDANDAAVRVLASASGSATSIVGAADMPTGGSVILILTITYHV